MFEPFDPVIVSPAAWRAGVGSLPRSFIAPVTAMVRARLPYIAEVEAALASGGTPDARLWSDIADLLEPASLPPAWNSTAFRAATEIRHGMLEPLCGATRLLFSQAGILRFASLGQELSRDALRPLLLAAARSGEVGWSIVTSLLLEQSPRPADLVESLVAFVRDTRLAHSLEPALQTVVAMVVNRLDKPPAEILTGDEALGAQARLAARIAGFSSLGGDMAGLTRQLAPLREEVAIKCRSDLASGFAEARGWTRMPPKQPGDEDAMAGRLECRLRALKRLDEASRPLGAAAEHERMLNETVAFCADGTQDSWLTRIDRLRLCEILVGAQAAQRFS